MSKTGLKNRYFWSRNVSSIVNGDLCKIQASDVKGFSPFHHGSQPTRFLDDRNFEWGTGSGPVTYFARLYID
ncbi:MAG: hypothetical protein P8X55_09975, partial [Desulfosarcinaceae bacterium]